MNYIRILLYIVIIGFILCILDYKLSRVNLFSDFKSDGEKMRDRNEQTSSEPGKK
jgi:hypothetical protein